MPKHSPIQVVDLTPFEWLFTNALYHYWFVCFITKSFLTYSFFHLHLLYQPYLGLCQAQCVQLHQRTITNNSQFSTMNTFRTGNRQPTFEFIISFSFCNKFSILPHLIASWQQYLTENCTELHNQKAWKATISRKFAIMFSNYLLNPW